MKKKDLSYNFVNFLYYNIGFIEGTFQANGISAKVAEISFLDNGDCDYYLDCPVDKKILEKIGEEIATKLTFLSKKAYWEILETGKHNARLKVPRSTEEYFETIRI